jgi:hypothetical protein
MRRLSPVMAIATLAFLAGCGPGDPGPIRESNWSEIRRSDVSCIGKVTMTADYYDLNGDGRDEAFLTMRCDDKNDPPGDQFEVFAGGTDPADTHPTKLVLQMPQAVVDRVCFRNQVAIYQVTTADGRSKIWQVRWKKDDPGPGKPTPGPVHGCP